MGVPLSESDYKLESCADTIVVSNFFDVEILESETGARPKTSSRASVLLSKTVSSSRLAKKIKQEHISDEDEEEGQKGRRPPEKRKIEETYIPNILICDICSKEEKESTTEVTEVSQVEKEILAFFFDFQVLKICKHHHKQIFVDFPNNQKACKSPFEPKHKKAVKNGLKLVSLYDAQQAFHCLDVSLKPGEKLCVNCRIKLYNAIEEKTQQEFDDPTPSSSQFSNYSERNSVRKMKEQEEDEKDKKIKELQNDADDLNLIMANIRDKFPNWTKEQKAAVLSVLPSSWSNRKVVEETGSSRRFASETIAHGLKERKQRSDKISEEDRKAASDFLLEPKMSKIIGGPKNYVIVRDENGKKDYIQKQLLEFKLRVCHQMFLEENPHIKMGFEVFRQCRPRQCVFAGSKGTLVTCTCINCRNPELKVTTSLLGDDETFYREITGLENVEVQLTLKDFVKTIVCADPTEDCYLDTCYSCRWKVQDLQDTLLKVCEVLEIYDMEYLQWLSTDYSQIYDVTEPVPVFIPNFCRDLTAYKQHSFLAGKQFQYFKHTTNNLENGHAQLVMDFSENYVYCTQKAVGNNFYKNKQASLHPAYFWVNVGGEIIEESVCVISESLDKKAHVVHCYIKTMMNYFKEKYPGISFMHYWSDGCPGQYKNLFAFLNIAAHSSDFQMECEWNFFPRKAVKKKLEIFQTGGRQFKEKIFGGVGTLYCTVLYCTKLYSTPKHNKLKGLKVTKE